MDNPFGNYGRKFESNYTLHVLLYGHYEIQLKEALGLA